MKIVKYVLAILAGLIFSLSIIYYLKVRIAEPEISGEARVERLKVEVLNENTYRFGNNLLHKNDQGLWEMHLQGNAYDRGVAFGALGQPLMKMKEAAFIGEIKNRIPSDFYLNFLKILVGWFNRDLDDFVPKEQLEEIYGAARFMPDNFDFIAPKYHRSLSYHAAHDIGHTLQNMNLVGCTAFAVWGENSKDQKLLIGRNFDFYFGEEFAKDKIVAFYKPEKGYKFASVTWAGFSGVVSGMNEKGLTITLNSAKSDIPTKGTTPVSLIARQILQYASTIQEAYEIARTYDSFVAESFLIGSKIDGKVGLIEKSPTTTALHMVPENRMIITNHFQSKELLNDALNQEYIGEGVSTYRYQRVEQLLDSLKPLDPLKVAAILRDKQGLDGKNIGLGNEKAINQLIAHHSVIFSPGDMLMWVSCAPFNTGKYLAYDLNKIFNSENTAKVENSYAAEASLSADPFQQTPAFREYQFFAQTRDRIQHYLFTGNGIPLSDKEVVDFENSNRDCFLTYYYLGDYFKNQEKWARAKTFYEKGLKLEIARNSEKKHMQDGLKQCTEALARD